MPKVTQYIQNNSSSDESDRKAVIRGRTFCDSATSLSSNEEGNTQLYRPKSRNTSRKTEQQ
jgi:hypothetical protein